LHVGLGAGHAVGIRAGKLVELSPGKNQELGPRVGVDRLSRQVHERHAAMVGNAALELVVGERTGLHPH
jgi:hypothetical protein